MPRQQKIPEDFTCEFCGVQKKVLGHRKFQEHYQEHFGDKFDCEQCSKSFSTKIKRQNHVRLERSNYKVKNVESESHGRKHFKCVLHLNAYNI